MDSLVGLDFANEITLHERLGTFSERNPITITSVFSFWGLPLSKWSPSERPTKATEGLLSYTFESDLLNVHFTSLFDLLLLFIFTSTCLKLQ